MKIERASRSQAASEGLRSDPGSKNGTHFISISGRVTRSIPKKFSLGDDFLTLNLCVTRFEFVGERDAFLVHHIGVDLARV